MSCVGTEVPTATWRWRRALVIGYGSPIRGDDALGPLAADYLAAQDLPAGVEVVSRHILTADLVPDIAAADLVIFIDAAIEGTPGEIHCQRLTPNPEAVSTMAHFLDPRELLAWAATLYDREPESYLVSAPGESFDFAGYELTASARRALQVALSEVDRLLKAPCREASRGRNSTVDP